MIIEEYLAIGLSAKENGAFDQSCEHNSAPCLGLLMAPDANSRF